MGNIAALAEDPAAKARAEAAKDAVAIIHLVTQGRLADVNAYLATLETSEVPDLIIAFGGLCAALLQHLDETLIGQGLPPMAGSFIAQLATDGLG